MKDAEVEGEEWDGERREKMSTNAWRAGEISLLEVQKASCVSVASTDGHVTD